MKPKPCPLCHSDNVIAKPHGVACNNCGLWLGDGTLVREKFGSALKAWNRRAPSEADKMLDCGVGGEMQKIIDKLADKIPNGHLVSCVSGKAFLEMVLDDINELEEYKNHSELINHNSKEIEEEK